MAQEKDVQNKAEDSAQRRKRPFAKTSPSQEEGKAATIGWRILGIACVCMSLLFLAVRSGMFDHTFSPRHGRHVFQPIPDPPNEQYSASELLAIGKELSTRGNAKSYQLAADYLRKAAELGKVEAQFLLAEIYDRGRGVPQSREKAPFWYRKAAEGRLYPQESREAMFILGRAYETGDGVPQDKKKALDWLRKAAGSGHAAAAYTLGMMYYRGDVLEKDIHEAAILLQRAAKNGDEKALDAMRQDELRKALEEADKAQ